MCPAPERIDEKPTAGVGDAPVDDATVKAWDLREGNTRKDMGASVESSWRESDAVEEKTAGIELYANAAAGFDGVLKERFSDFIVREIDKDTGKAVRLDDLSAAVDVPIDARERAKFDEMKARVLAMEKEAGLSEDKGDESEEGEGDDQIDEDAMTEFEALCGAEDAQRLREFLATPGVTRASQKKLHSRAVLPDPLVLAPMTDKVKRTQIHQFFKRHFFLPTDNIAISVEAKKEAEKNSQKPPSSVRVHHAEKRGKKRSRIEALDHRAGRNFWPEGVPEHVRFVFCKENKESHEMLSVISRALKINFKTMGIAGTKDKRAVTTQHVTVHRIRAKRLAKLVLYGCKIGNYSYVDEQLGFGDHNGNEFEVTIRGVDPEDVQNVETAVDALNSSGTINYFGLQRFGTTGGKHATHKIGIELLRGNWQTAIDALLLPREGERSDVGDARAAWEKNKDPAEMLKALPRWCAAERAIVERMMKVSANDVVSCLLAIPKQIRMMYIHAYQGYLFNRVVSARVRKYGMNTVVEGDLVLEDGEIVDEEETMTGRVSMPRVRVVSADEAALGKIDPALVVLPLPGNAVMYPENMGEIYQDLANEDGIQLNANVHSVREFAINAFTGDYRRCFLKPSDVSHKVVSYADPKADLTLTDLDRMNGITERNIEDGPLRAVTVKFTLPPSSYATMILRELMKSNTSVASHKKKTLDSRENDNS